MLKVDLIENRLDKHYSFFVDTGERILYDSYKLAKAFNLSRLGFANILIDEVIKHSKFIFYNDIDGEIVDVTFKLNNLSKEVYIERFKETFTEQLMLLVLGGV